MTYKVCLIHPFDPRGKKVGGLETYTRDYITFHPDDFEILLIGVDETGDLKLGEIVDLTFRGRSFRFMPILHYPEEEMREAARALTASITFQFFFALLRFFFKIRGELAKGDWNIELRRMEFSPIAWLLRKPFIQMLHGEGAPHQAMDSLLRKYWLVQSFNERFAVAHCRKFLCVNSNIKERVRKDYPKYRDKVEVITTWANTSFYKPAPMREADGYFRIIFCGRLDKFKRPSLIFKTIAQLAEKLNGKVHFHYVGASDTARFPEFESIRDITTLHGYQDASGISGILQNIDAGILASEFEGMPRFVLETLCSGRPVVSSHLPQLEEVIEDGVSGFLVPYIEDEQRQIDALIGGFVELRDLIANGKIDPFAVNKKTKRFSPESLLGQVYQYHRDIENAKLSQRGRYSVILMHPMDPRGNKVGGIETHLRLMIQYAPIDCDITFVGVDSMGDCPVGVITEQEIGGRKFSFLPVCHYPEAQVHAAAKRIRDSLTVHFAFGLVRHFFKIFKLVHQRPSSIELQRFEFALFPRLLGVPGLQIIHGEGSKQDKMDSLIKKYWFLHRLNEEIAIRVAKTIVCVNPAIEKRVVSKLGANPDRIVCMPVSVDMSVFQCREFDTTDNIFRIIFAGRLDEFKDPPTMFRALNEACKRLNGGLEFHYVGTSDARRYPEFELIEAITTLYGFCKPAEVAEITSRCHAGILTSFFEGMPCYLLEVLAVGRPVVSIRLPQYDLVLEQGIRRFSADRLADEQSTVSMVADLLLEAWRAIKDGEIVPRVVSDNVRPYSVDVQFADHFARHRYLALGQRSVEPDDHLVSDQASKARSLDSRML